MTDLPWRSERTLDAALVTRVLDAQCPRLRPALAIHLAEGWDFDAWLVHNAFVVRFPKRAGAAPSLATERAWLPVLAPRLPLPIPAPEIFGEPSAEFPLPFLGYRRLEGVPASRAPGAPLAHAEVLGRFLSRLHGTDPGLAAALPVVGPRPALERARAWWPETSKGAPADLKGPIESLLSRDDPPSPSVRRVCHSDLRPDHVLLAEGGRSITGVIDWGDLCLDDPAMDFAGLVLWGGAPLLDAVLNRYEGAVDAGLPARARRRAALAALSLLGWGVRTGDRDEIAVASAQLRRAF